MGGQKKCIIWGTELQSTPLFSGSSIGYYEYDSPRAGGKYLVPQGVHDSIPIFHGVTLEDKIRLSGYIAKQNLLSKTPPLLDSIMTGKKCLESLSQKPNYNEKTELLLKGLVNLSHPGEGISLNSNIDQNRHSDTSFLYALSYCSKFRGFSINDRYLRNK